MNLEILLYILLGFLLLMIILVIPFLYQLWLTVKQLTITLCNLNERLPAILKNLEEITGNMNEASQNVNARITELSVAFQRAHAFLNTVQSVEQVVRSRIGFPFLRVFQNALPLLKGSQAFCRTLNISRKNQE